MSKTILITGATDGIGKRTAELLATEGHTLLLHGRNPDKLQAVARELQGAHRLYCADFSRLDAVEAMAAQIRAEHTRVDVVINNAGVFKTGQPLTAEGLDVRFVVNTLAPVVLTRALWSLMPKTGRVVNLSSAAQAPVNPEALAGRVAVGEMAAYAQSKLALTIWSQALAASHPEGPVVVAVNPGSYLASKMVKEGFGVAGNDLSIGARILARAALSEEFVQASGQYFDNDIGRFAPPHPAAQEPAHVAAVLEAIEATISAHQED